MSKVPEVPLVRDFMDKTFVTLKPEMGIYEAIDLLLKNKITSAAVVDEEGNLAGILSEKDCLKTMLHGIYDNIPGGQVSQYMTKAVKCISPDTDVYECANIFLSHFFRRILITDKGKLVGQITRRDLLRGIQEVKMKFEKENKYHPRSSAVKWN